MDYVLNFEEVDRDSLQRVGGKNASLGEMIRAGIRVPPGFAVTTASYQYFLDEAGVREQIFRIVSSINPEDTGALIEASQHVRALMDAAPIPEAVQSAVRGHYGQLCKAFGADAVPVAVRSSATAEDLPTASFAGQQDTYLWVQGLQPVLRDVRRCWSSLFTPRAISYRIKNGFPHDKVYISVGVQKMVNSRAAGVMFTLNPTDGDLSKVLIEGSWGLGETVVSGSVNPDKFVLDKVLLEFSERTVSAKLVECVFDPAKGEVTNAEVEEKRQRLCCLQDREVRRLVETAKRIEEHYGCPMDIEWAIDKDLDFPQNIFIVQARPETVWSQRKKGSVLGKKTGYELLMERAMKRIKLS
jgi:pyruvate,water dikinase